MYYPEGYRWLSGKESTCQCRRLEFNPWVRKTLGREMATHSSILLGKFHGQRSLEGHSSWGCKESDTPERPSNALFRSGRLPAGAARSSVRLSLLSRILHPEPLWVSPEPLRVSPLSPCESLPEPLWGSSQSVLGAGGPHRLRFLTYLIPLVRLLVPLRNNLLSWFQLTEQTKILKKRV